MDVTREQLRDALAKMRITIEEPEVSASVHGGPDGWQPLWAKGAPKFPAELAEVVLMFIETGQGVADDDEPERCPDCHMPLTMHHDPGCSQPCGRCEARKAADPELSAVTRILAELDGLEGGEASVLRSSAVQRVLTYVLDRHGWAIAGAQTCEGGC